MAVPDDPATSWSRSPARSPPRRTTAGRGRAAIGIGRSGACDRTSYALANRLVGNRPGAVALEVTLGGLVLRAEDEVTVVTTGARCPGRPTTGRCGCAPASVLRLGAPATGLRTYVAVRGGLAVDPVLGSRRHRRARRARSARPWPPVTGCRSGGEAGELPLVDVAAVAEHAGRRGWRSRRARTAPRLVRRRRVAAARLTRTYVVSGESNRVGVRLEGEPLQRSRDGELPSEGMLRGALQVPPSGLPVLFLADHPVTGGYPVIGYVDDADVDRCAQLRPGQRLRLLPGTASLG